MSKRAVPILVVVCVTLLATTCVAQDESLIFTQKGVKELSFAGMASFDTDYWLAMVSYGEFISDHLQVGGSLMGNDEVQFLSLFGQQHFAQPAQETVPFLGLSILSISGDDFDTTYGWGAEGGVKHFVNENSSIFAKLVYNDSFENDGSGGTQLVVGVSALYR